MPTPASDIPQARRVLAIDGAVLPGAAVPDLDDATLVRMDEVMALGRALDAQLAALTHGAAGDAPVGFHLPARGDEATQLAVAALAPTDWVFPSPRDQLAWLWRGTPIGQLVDQLFGNAGDPCHGRQLPVHHADRARRLVSISGPRKGEQFELRANGSSVGRDPANAIVLDHLSVSRRHCLIFQKDEDWSIRDLDSRNGTRVNQIPVKERDLRHGDEVEVGDCLFLFVSQESAGHGTAGVEPQRTRTIVRAEESRYLAAGEMRKELECSSADRSAENSEPMALKSLDKVLAAVDRIVDLSREIDRCGPTTQVRTIPASVLQRLSPWEGLDDAIRARWPSGPRYGEAFLGWASGH